MKFKIRITKEVIDKSLKCNTNNIDFPQNCAFAVAFNELIPGATVTQSYTNFYDVNNKRIGVWNYGQEREDIESFINTFDDMQKNPQERYSLVGQEFEIEIPQKVIDYWYSDIVEVIQKIINSEILQLV